MNYIKISKCDVANGIGVRTVLWVSGCSHKCPGCHNPHTWDENEGKVFDSNAKEELFKALNQSYVSGITFSGGDPLYKNNVETILELIKDIKTKLPDKSIWLYTGYTVEEAFKNTQKDNLMELRKEIISLCDIVVDGPFVQKQKDLMLKWKGSSNQRVIDIKKSLAENKIILAY